MLETEKKDDDYTFELEFFEKLHGRLPKDASVVEILGGLYSKFGRIDDGLKMDRKLVRLTPNSATAHYNLGCSLALKRRKADAIRALQRAVELGYRDIDWIKDDPDLKALAQHPAFHSLLFDIEERIQIERQ